MRTFSLLNLAQELTGDESLRLLKGRDLLWHALPKVLAPGRKPSEVELRLIAHLGKNRSKQQRGSGLLGLMSCASLLSELKLL